MKNLSFSQVENLSFEQKYNELMNEVYSSYEELHNDYVSRYEEEQVENFIDFINSVYYCILCD